MDIGFCGRESHPQSRELLSLLPWYIDFEVLFTDLPQVWLRADHPALREEWDLAAFLRYPHITICWEQRDTWALDDVLQELGYKRNVALTVPGFEQSLFMAAQPQHTMLATAPRYCQHYNQQHQLPLVSRPPGGAASGKSCAFPSPCYGISATATTRSLSGLEIR